MRSRDGLPTATTLPARSQGATGLENSMSFLKKRTWQCVSCSLCQLTHTSCHTTTKQAHCPPLSLPLLLQPAMLLVHAAVAILTLLVMLQLAGHGKSFIN
jgi:hypothetical protein